MTLALYPTEYSEGHGPLSAAYGMGADNILQATVVTPDGEILVANACQNSDLYYAIRGGGGGTYGVVTQLVMKAFPSPKSTFHLFSARLIDPDAESQYWDFIAWLHAKLGDLKDGGMQGYYVVEGPPYFAPTWSFNWAFYLFNKPNGTAEALFAPIKEKLDAMDGTIIYETSVISKANYYDLWTQTSGYEVVGYSIALGSRFLSRRALSNTTAIAKTLQNVTAVSSIVVSFIPCFRIPRPV
jgi:hypothetical protein